MRILHLGYEDPAQPGSGGGSVRTYEVNRRLAANHEITVVVAGYPGAKPRVEHGVRWEPLWPRSGGKMDRLAYFAQLGPAVMRHPHDMLVEDFGAPFGPGLAPLYTRKPVVAVVQWLFTREMREKYHFPFDAVERQTVKLYSDFIVVSGWLADSLRTRVPKAHFSVVPNGVEPAAFATTASVPRHLLFVGRLDIMQKGCDLLVKIVARARKLLGDRMPRVLIAGDGPDRPAIAAAIASEGLGDTVQLLGRIDGATKYRLMADSYAVLMPSRFETFGMVAVEAQAAGAPLIAFDVGPLREVSAGGGARLVAPFDLDTFAREAAICVDRAEEMRGVREAGRHWARRYDWDEIARAQGRIYEQIAARRQGRVAGPVTLSNSGGEGR